MSTSLNSSNPTPRTRVVSEPQRAVYDRDAVNHILDEALFCHVGFVADGQPFVIPMSFGRDGDVLYIHGSTTSRMVRNLDQGAPVCITVTLVDGLVLARSVFNHSMNYRSVVILGTATLVDDPAEKLSALRALSEHILPHRWDDSRQPKEKELKATSGLLLPKTDLLNTLYLLVINSRRIPLHSRQDSFSLCGLCRPSSINRASAPASASCARSISPGSVRGSCLPCTNVTGTFISRRRPS